MLNKNRIIIILCLIILGLLILLYYKHNQIQGIKRSVITSWERNLKRIVNKKKSALVNIATLPSGDNHSKLEILGSLDAKPRVPCGKIILNINQQYKGADKQRSKNNTDCSSTIIDADENFKKAFDALGTYSLTIHNGEKNIKVTAHSILITSSSGSYCSTTYVGADQYQSCVTQQEECDEYRTYDFPSSFWTLDEFLEEFTECKGLVHN